MTAHSPSTTESASSDSDDRTVGRGTSPVVAETPSPYGLAYHAARGTSPGYDSRWRWQEEDEDMDVVGENYNSIDETMADFNGWSDDEDIERDTALRDSFLGGMDPGPEPEWGSFSE